MNNAEEKVVAVVAPQKANGESDLKKEVTKIEAYAKEISVTSDEEYKSAADFGRELKSEIKKVKEFFKPMKSAAKDAHKKICDREKEMLNPLENAEKLIKGTMGGYVAKKEAERRAIEEAARQKALEEANKKLEMAAEAEANGDSGAAKEAMFDAEIADSASRTITVEKQQPKAEGVAIKKTYEIVSVDEDKVPIKFAGMTIRPVDTKAVMSLIRASKGTIKIDGIVYKETNNIAFRGK